MGLTERLLDTVSEPARAPDPAARPRLGLAVVTCMDARIDPVALFGLTPGDAHVLRNAGGVVTDDVVRSLWKMITANLERHQIELVAGRARFEAPDRLRIAGPDGLERLLQAPVVLVATGSYPNWPDGIPRDPARLYDSDTILEMESIPRSLIVVGAGVIGCEYATIFRALGVDVTLVCGHDRLLPFLDRELADRLATQLGLLGIRLLFDETLDRWTLLGAGIIFGANAYIAHREAVLSRRAASEASSAGAKPGE